MIDYTTLPSREIERLARQIGPGEWAIEGDRPIATLLGSCVAVCLYDSALPIAGMNHFMLPKMSSKHNAAEDVLLAGDACMEALLNGLLARGAKKVRMQAKAFGGGTVINTKLPNSLSIGLRNADFARQWLTRENIPLTASDFLGPWSRKVLFVPKNGDVYCKRQVTSMITEETLKREEAAYLQSVQGAPPSSDSKKIELF